MKTKIFFTTIAFGLVLMAYGQKPTMEFTFTAVDNSDLIELDSLKVMNLTQGGDTVLYPPVTVLSLEYQVGTDELLNIGNNLKVFQNYPNPVSDQTLIALFIPEKGEVNLLVTDITGRQVLQTKQLLDKGYHSFRFIPGNAELYFFTARWEGSSSSIKILHFQSGLSRDCSLEYIGSENTGPILKTIDAVQNFSYSLGNELLFIGYAYSVQSVILDAPATSESYELQFATNIPCPETPTVTYEGQVYNTIQIFSQCWLRENLNVGTMINGDQDMLNNGVIEKYCYSEDEINCAAYGGLYQWHELMQYATMQGVQGICPPGWHIPSDQEWKLLEGVVDSQHGTDDPIWNVEGYRGFDAGLNLKSTTGWEGGGNGTDLFGFSGLPGGGRFEGVYEDKLDDGFWWTSTGHDSEASWLRGLDSLYPTVDRDDDLRPFALSVRCLRNE